MRTSETTRLTCPSAFGRRRMYGVELGIIILATLSCALVSSSPSMGSTGLLIFWRILMVNILQSSLIGLALVNAE